MWYSSTQKQNTIYDILSHHASFGRSIIAAAGAVGHKTIGKDPAEISGYNTMKGKGIQSVHIVENHIHYNTQSVLMQLMNQFF